MRAYTDPPEWFRDDSKRAFINLQPASACIWPYEAMYSDDVKNPPGSGQKYNYNLRLERAKEYFSDLEVDHSLLFYYVNYSNPFSEDESKKYVLVGISRLKSKGDIIFYDDVSKQNREKYAGGFVWQLPLTSHYPEQGFSIPYHKYRDNLEVLSKILVLPENPRCFKYATRPVSDDEAVVIIEQFLESVNTLISISDDTQDWLARKSWLHSLLGELWHHRGAYPGSIGVLNFLKFYDGIKYYRDAAEAGNDKSAYDKIISFLTGKGTIPGISSDSKESKEALRNYKLLRNNQRKLLSEVLPRIYLSEKQISNILSSKREENGIYSEIEDICANPYILSEQYVGSDADDYISFNTVDNGVLPSPDLGLDPLFTSNSAERFRALCIDALKKESPHSFVSINRIIDQVNDRLAIKPDWKKVSFEDTYFEADEDLLSDAMQISKQGEGKYVYLKSIYEDERKIQAVIEDLASRPDIKIRI
ncbi:MAG: hypothetical protein ACHQUC_10320, partial [Chlamydiales bacterium]